LLSGDSKYSLQLLTDEQDQPITSVIRDLVLT